jgi:hypothetical protein
MTNQRKIFLIGGLAVPGTLIALGLNFHQTAPTNESKAQSKNSAAVAAESVTSERGGSTSKEDYLAKTAAEAAQFAASNPHYSAPQNQTSDPVERSSDFPSLATSSRNAEVAPSEDQTEIHSPRMPLVFLDYSGVLPDTPEVAAAVQRLRQNFIDSTGAATANPYDPNYAARWDQAQPTADEIFCALFGTEACNALSIVRRHEIGHF